MKPLLVPFAVGVLILLIILLAKFLGGWKVLHQRVMGWTVLFYGMWLATLTGTVTKLVLPGLGAVGGGAAAGAGCGLLTYFVIGTVGVVTGGVGLAVGAGVMATIGGVLGAVGGTVGGFGFKTITYPLISPWAWVPICIIGVYFILGRSSAEKTKNSDKFDK